MLIWKLRSQTKNYHHHKHLLLDATLSQFIAMRHLVCFYNIHVHIIFNLQLYLPRNLSLSPSLSPLPHAITKCIVLDSFYKHSLSNIQNI